MSNFIESASSRETSPELMEAIYEVSGRDEKRAVDIWENGPTGGELVAIIEIVTNNGLGYETTDFVWGEQGANWEKAFDD